MPARHGARVGGVGTVMSTAAPTVTMNRSPPSTPTAVSTSSAMSEAAAESRISRRRGVQSGGIGRNVNNLMGSSGVTQAAGAACATLGRKKTGGSSSSDSLQFYMNNLGKVKLLKASEEVTLGRQIQKAMRHERVRDHLEAIRGTPPTVEEWAYAVGLTGEELEQQIMTSETAKKSMISANLRLVVSVSKKYRYRGLPFSDVIQEGTLGLVRATEKFDPERGFKFSTYAVWWIRQSILKGVMEQVRERENRPHVGEHESFRALYVFLCSLDKIQSHASKYHLNTTVNNSNGN